MKDDDMEEPILMIRTTPVTNGSRRCAQLLASLLIPAVLVCPLRGQELNKKTADDALRLRERWWRSIADTEPPGSLGVRTLFEYAFELAEYDRNLDRIDRLFELAEQMQDCSEADDNPAYGNFRWYWRTPEVTDKNAVEFICLHALPIWIKHRDRLSEDGRARLERLLLRSIEGCLRHRVRPGYTNIALSNAANLIVLGETFDRPDVVESGRQRLADVLVCTWQNGVVEYVSPTYYGVDLDELKFLDQYAKDPEVRKQTEVLLDLFWADLAANWYPAAESLAGSQSRTYNYLAGISEALDRHLRLVGWMSQREDVPVRAPQLDALSGRYDPSAKWRERCHTEHPRLVRQRFGAGPTDWRTLAVWDDIALGCSGAYYGSTDVPLAVDLPGARELPRCYFLGDGREDPYGKKKFPTGSAGHHKALHLQYDWLGVQRGEDALALVSYPARVFDNPLVTNLQSHFVFRTPEAILIDGQAFEVPDQPGWQKELPLRATLTIKYGSAAIGVRVPWSRDQEGNPAALTLASDGNRWGVMRLTVEHRRDSELLPVEQVVAEPAALLWLRVAHGLKSDEALADWDAEFRLAQVHVALSEDLAEFTASGSEGPLSLHVEQPSTPASYAKTTPAGPQGILEVDGVEIGRPLLESLEPLHAIAEIQANYQPEQVPDSGTHLWEGEDAIVFPGHFGEDEKASGKRYVTVNSEVTWRLKIPAAGTYYLWARIQADDPEHDSCYVQWAPGATGRARHDWHVTRGKDWHWDRVAFAKSKEPAQWELAEGVAEFTFSIREPGLRIDQLFLTKDPDAVPPEFEGR